MGVVNHNYNIKRNYDYNKLISTFLCLFLFILYIGVANSEVYIPRNISAPKVEIPVTQVEDLYYIKMLVGTPTQEQKLSINTESDQVYLIDAHNCKSIKANTTCFQTEESTSFHSEKEKNSNIVEANDYFQIYGVPQRTQYTFRLNATQYYLIDGIDGSFGLNTQNVYSLFEPTWDHVIGIDLRNKDDLKIHLGGYKSEEGEDIDWSEMSLTNKFFEFPLFQLSFCGYSMFSSSSFQMARLVSNSPCLSVPPDAFYSIIHLLPGRCHEIGDDNPNYRNYDDYDEYDYINNQKSRDGKGIRCYFSETSLVYNFLSFSLSEHGKIFQFPVSAFITKSEYTENYNLVEYCITNTGEANSYIELGTYLWKFFYIIEDYAQNRIGLYQNSTDINLYEKYQICPFIPLCASTQTYRRTTNSCEDPDCSIYFFQYLLLNSYDCRYERYYLILVFTVFIIAIGLEITVFEIRLRFIRRVHSEQPYYLRTLSSSSLSS